MLTMDILVMNISFVEKYFFVRVFSICTELCIESIVQYTVHTYVGGGITYRHFGNAEA